MYHKIYSKRVPMDNSAEYLDSNNRENKSYKQIKRAYETLRNLCKEEKHEFYIAGGIVPYLLLSQDSNRTHDDIDIIARMEDMEYFRQLFQNVKLYKPEYDSKTFAKDGIDYGFETIIEGVPVGIYPFTYKDKKITQYSYDPYVRHCKIKELNVEELSDYIMTYEGIDGRKYRTMSMEYIRFSKEKANRPKDIVDIEKINNYGIRKEVYSRLQMFTQIQDAKAERLNFIKRIEEKVTNNNLSNNHIIKSPTNDRDEIE